MFQLQPACALEFRKTERTRTEDKRKNMPMGSILSEKFASCEARLSVDRFNKISVNFWTMVPLIG